MKRIRILGMLLCSLWLLTLGANAALITDIESGESEEELLSL